MRFTLKTSIQKIVYRSAIGSLMTLAASAALAQTPSTVRVRSFSYAGSGCPAGSLAQSISDDRQAFTIFFDYYEADVGPGVPFQQRRKNCQLALNLDYPGGWSYSIISLDYRGFVSLDRGVTALQQSSYYFQGFSQSATLSSVFRGPENRDYQLRDTLVLDSLVWSPCGAGRALNINTQLRVENSGNSRGSGHITLDSISGPRMTYGIRWRRC